MLFHRLDGVVKASPSLRAIMPDFFGTAKRGLDRLAQQPVTVMVDSQSVLVSKDDVQTVIALQSGEQAFVRRLPALIGQMDAGNFNVMARVVRDAIKNRPLGTVMTYMMDLASGVSDERARKIRGQVPGALLGNAAPDLGPQFRAPIKSDVPALFISGTLDGRTSLGDAEEVRRTAAQEGAGSAKRRTMRRPVHQAAMPGTSATMATRKTRTVANTRWTCVVRVETCRTEVSLRASQRLSC